MLDWLQNRHTVLWAFIGLSAFTLVVSLIVVPVMIVRIPPDYFSPSAKHPHPFTDRHPAVRALLFAGKNLLGVVLIILGVLMLVLPGQGVLTMLAGLVLVDFPGRQRAVRWIVLRQAVFRSMNWIRQRAGKEPLAVDRVGLAEPARTG